MSDSAKHSGFRSYDLYAGIQKNVVIGFYTVTAVALYLGFGYIVNNYTFLGFEVKIVLTIIYLCAAVILGVFFYAVLDITSRISGKFDVIKNDIASKKIKTPYQFAERLGRFFINFFSLSFFDISFSIVKFPDTEYYYSDKLVKSAVENDIPELIRYSKNNKEIYLSGKYNISGKNYNLYLIPIWFGNKWLGFTAVMLRRRLPKIFRAFLMDFENHYLDDQLMHVFDYHVISIQKEIFREIDAFSNRIICGEYKNIEEYKKDILKYLTEKIRCLGGIFISTFSDTVPYNFGETYSESVDDIIEHYKKKPHPKTYTIYSDLKSDIFKYTFALPVLIENGSATIYLCDNDDMRFSFFGEILAEVENFKLASDLANLAKQLNN